MKLKVQMQVQVQATVPRPTRLGPCSGPPRLLPRPRALVPEPKVPVLLLRLLPPDLVFAHPALRLALVLVLANRQAPVLLPQAQDPDLRRLRLLLQSNLSRLLSTRRLRRVFELFFLLLGLVGLVEALAA